MVRNSSARPGSVSLLQTSAVSSEQEALANLVADKVARRLQTQLARIEQQLNSRGQLSPLQSASASPASEPSPTRFNRAGLSVGCSPAEELRFLHAEEASSSEEELDYGTSEWPLLDQYYQKLNKLSYCGQGCWPQADSRLGRFVDSKLNGLGYIVVLLNIGFMWYVVDRPNQHFRQHLHEQWRMDDHSNFRLLLAFYAEWFFVSFYTIEVLLRLCVHKCRFFFDDEWGWNVFDLIVTGAGLWEIAWMHLHGRSDQMSNITLLRGFRIFRLSRALRFLKAFTFTADLRLMARCVVKSVSSLFWAIIFMTVILLIFSLLLTESMKHHLYENLDELSEEQSVEIKRRFATCEKTMLTLFQASSGGMDWGDVFDLVCLAGKLPELFFLGYVVFFYFAFLNVVTSIFVSKALKEAKPDEEDIVKERLLEDQDDRRQLELIFHAVDRDSSGAISMEELKRASKDHHISYQFEMMGITIRDAYDAETFFKNMRAMARQHQQVDAVDEATFINGCMKMRGASNSIDVLSIRLHLQDLKLAVAEGYTSELRGS